MTGEILMWFTTSCIHNGHELTNQESFKLLRSAHAFNYLVEGNVRALILYRKLNFRSLLNFYLAILSWVSLLPFQTQSTYIPVGTHVILFAVIFLSNMTIFRKLCVLFDFFCWFSQLCNGIVIMQLGS